MDPHTNLLTDMLTRHVLSPAQFAAEMACRSGFQPPNPRLAAVVVVAIVSAARAARKGPGS